MSKTYNVYVFDRYLKGALVNKYTVKTRTRFGAKRIVAKLIKESGYDPKSYLIK